MESFQTPLKVSENSGKFPDTGKFTNNLENFPDTLDEVLEEHEVLEDLEYNE